MINSESQMHNPGLRLSLNQENQGMFPAPTMSLVLMISNNSLLLQKGQKDPLCGVGTAKS